MEHWLSYCVLYSSDDEEVIKRRQEAKLVADLMIEGKESRRHRHKKRRSRRKHKRCVYGDI